MKPGEPKPPGMDDIRGVKPEKLNGEQIITLLTGISHATWMKQAAVAPKWKDKELPKEPFADDKSRAEDAWRILEEKKPKTKEEAVKIVARSSHIMWLVFQGKLRAQPDYRGATDALDPNPNDHDVERAEDIVNALQIAGVLSFES